MRRSFEGVRLGRVEAVVIPVLVEQPDSADDQARPQKPEHPNTTAKTRRAIISTSRICHVDETFYLRLEQLAATFLATNGFRTPIDEPWKTATLVM